MHLQSCEATKEERQEAKQIQDAEENDDALDTGIIGSKEYTYTRGVESFGIHVCKR